MGLIKLLTGINPTTIYPILTLKDMKGGANMELLLLPMGGISLNHILLGFAGGLVGACFAALPIFVICGVFIIAGVALTFTSAGGPVFLELQPGLR